MSIKVKSVKKLEAKNELTAPRTMDILGVEVSGTNKQRLLNEIFIKISKKSFTKPFFIITAYSENILETETDPELGRAFEAADRVVADGVSVLAAWDYLKARSRDRWADLWLGYGIGGKILRGEYADKKIVGVKLAEELLDMADSRNWKIYLLGGWPGMVKKIAAKHKSVTGYDVGYKNIKMQKNDVRLNNEIVRKINDKKPDILLVGLGRFEQEKWIAKNLDKLKVKAVMGIGSGFDEMTGDYGVWTGDSPEWVERMGLKWLWRGLKDPKNLRRAWNAFPVFAWKVYRSPK